jgi:signal transduction histidine kinase
MRPVCWVLAAVGGGATAATVAIATARGDFGEAGWTLVGPGAIYAVGLIAVVRRPRLAGAAWLLATGAAFALEVLLGDVLLPLVAGAPYAWVVALARWLAGEASVVAGIGMFGLFPTGVPERGERAVLWAAAVVGGLLPLLTAVSNPTLPKGMVPNPAEPTITSPLFLPALAPLGTVAGFLYYGFVGCIALATVMLYLRYRRSAPDGRRRIRWLLVGVVVALTVYAALTALAWTLGPDVSAAAARLLWPLVGLLLLGSLVVGFSHAGVFGIDQPLRRSLAYRVLWALIAVVYVATAAALGVLAGRYLPIGAAVLLAAAAALMFQPARRRLERLADRWVFGARLDGYDVLTRLGTTLETSPGPAELLPRLADAVRQGLGLRWARVSLEPPAAGGPAPTATAGTENDRAEPALVVPLTYAGTVLGRIECGPGREGPLLDEDRRLLGHLTGQAATAVRNLHLAAELSARLDVIRRQAAELTASRARIAQAQDAERRRIQRDLHDSVQQDLVVATAKLAMARERLRRDDPRADETLAELQRDLGGLLTYLREFAHAIHPPVLADQGLLEAIEAQAARLPLEMLVEADPALRGCRYPTHIETATWYALSEALTNTVKHAHARQVVVSLRQPDSRLVVEVRDDGRGFDPATARGLGLTGLADRMSIVDGVMFVDSAPGQGTTLRVEIPLTQPEGGNA